MLSVEIEGMLEDVKDSFMGDSMGDSIVSHDSQKFQNHYDLFIWESRTLRFMS